MTVFIWAIAMSVLWLATAGCLAVATYYHLRQHRAEHDGRELWHQARHTEQLWRKDP